MKGFLGGAAFCLGLLLLMGAAPQVSNKFEDAVQIEQEFFSVNKFIQNPYMRVMGSTPSANQLMEGQIVLVNTGGVTSLFSKVKGSTFSVVLGR